MPLAQPTIYAIGAVARRLERSPYLLSTEEVSRFWQRGLLGPLACEAQQLDGLLDRLHAAAPASDDSGKRNVYDPQHDLAVVHELARHPSILHPVAQLLGCEELSFFQARFRVKAPGRQDNQPWHQDVGKYHGGLFVDGTPIPSITLWLSLDGADAESGGVVWIPGSHRSLLGDWRQGFHGLKDLQHTIEASAAEELTISPAEFVLFHSWAVHCSLTNVSTRPRSALILRYMDRRHALDVSFPHHPCAIT
jgi:ectoine hydroxylase-related dioxygenase (phytanoyl-CoA dioxygenase family)